MPTVDREMLGYDVQALRTMPVLRGFYLAGGMLTCCPKCADTVEPTDGLTVWEQAALQEDEDAQVITDEDCWEIEQEDNRPMQCSLCDNIL